MPYPQFDRHLLKIKPLSERYNKVYIEKDYVRLDTPVPEDCGIDETLMEEVVGRIRKARSNGRPVMMAFGAHSIKNGLGPLMVDLMERGWLTHLATNGAGIIHDWEFAYQGQSSEDVRANVKQGQFGIWQETGYYINLAIVVGAYEGLGYGESVGSMIEHEGLMIPEEEALAEEIRRCAADDPGRAAGAARS